MTDNTDFSHGKVAPESLQLRAQPGAVTRFNKKLLMGLSGGGIIMIFTATFYALQPREHSGEKHPELYNVTNKETPDSLNELPGSYQEYKPSKLGAPLPGELGGAVLSAERRAGLAPPSEMPGRLPFQGDTLADSVRAERIRLAQRAQQGREAAVFFQIRQRAQASVSQNKKPDVLEREQTSHRQRPDSDIYNSSQLQVPTSPYQVMAGTVIAASLVTGLNSDLPGRVIAQVSEPVYDTVTGQYLLIPQGSRLLGKYESKVAYGQSRALVVWQRLILPDGSSLVLDNLPATNMSGYSGLEHQVDYHTWGLIKGIALSTLFSVGSELAVTAG